MADFDNTRSFQFKPDFDMCMARIYAWYEQRIIDRPPVRFLHHNSVIVDLKMHELDEFIKKVDPTGIMLWIPAEPSEQKDILERVSQW